MVCQASATFILVLFVGCSMPLQLVELSVPSHVALDTPAQLACKWHLGPGEVLYSVKWYKDGMEFFRHVPKDKEQRRQFPLPGVSVQESTPNGSNVTLGPVAMETGGRYRCEVSGERPLFPTVSDHADMTIVVLPNTGPVITGLRPRYGPGDRLHATCTSGRSRPTTHLTWYVNGEPAPLEAVGPLVVEPRHDLEVTRRALEFVLNEDDFKGYGIKIKCLATLLPLYWKSNEESALRERIRIPSVDPDTRRETTDASQTLADRIHEASTSASHCTLCKNYGLFRLYITIFLPHFLIITSCK